MMSANSEQALREVSGSHVVRIGERVGDNPMTRELICSCGWKTVSHSTAIDAVVGRHVQEAEGGR